MNSTQIITFTITSDTSFYTTTSTTLAIRPPESPKEKHRNKKLKEARLIQAESKKKHKPSTLMSCLTTSLSR